MRVAIFEPSHSGHRLTYVRLLAQALCKLPVEVHLFLGKHAAESVEYLHQIAPLSGKVEIHPDSDAGSYGMVRTAIAHVRSLERAVSEIKPDRLYIPCADGLAQLMAVSRIVGRPAYSMGLEGLLLRGAAAYDQPSPVQKMRAELSRLLVARSHWDTLHYLDPYALEDRLRRGGEITGRLRLMPDPIEAGPPRTREEARRHLGVPVGGRYIGCCGAIDERKGADKLIRAFASSRLAPSDRLLLLGRQSPGIAAIVSELREEMPEERLIARDAYTSDDELWSAVCACDVVATLYPRHIGSASIVIRAAEAGRYVLGSSFGWIGRTVSRFGLGSVCNVLDSAALPAALERALTEAESWRAGEGARALAAFHTVANFQGHWTRELRRLLGLPPQVLRAWDGAEQECQEAPL